MPTVAAIDNVRVFTGSGLTEPRRILIDGASIAASGIPHTVVEGEGKVLLPGLIDSHVHTVRGRADLEDLAKWGVTTGLDMAAWPATFVAEMRKQTGVAQIFSATIPAVGPGGSHAKLPGFPAEGVVTTVQQARTFVERRIADGADYVKIITEATAPEGMDQDTVNAIVEVAHEHGLLVVAHSITTDAFHVALDAGVDVSTHAPLNAVLDEDAVSRMRSAGMVCSPTLTMMEGTADLRAAAGLKYEYARETVSRLHASGVRILAGTDANSAPGAPFAPRHGESMHHELELLVAAGLSPTEALRGATVLCAQTFGLDDRGVIEPGKRADLLLIDGDPVADISATRNIAGVWIAGERLQ